MVPSDARGRVQVLEHTPTRRHGATIHTRSVVEWITLDQTCRQEQHNPADEISECLGGSKQRVFL